MKYVIGVDLGTTNIVVSYSKVADDNGAQTVFPIKQLVAPGQIQALPMLPALRYHYTSELTEEQVRLPWQLDNYNASLPAAVIGRYAAELGSRNPQRLVVSAKSWLSFRAESNSEIQLPDKADEQIDTITPMESTASYLNYLRSAWDHEFPEAPFTQQSIVVTVPASFDDMARALTIEAINRAGIKDFRLLEEPQAACYHWLADNDVQTLNNSKHLMVCDIGGGTTDFTLIKVDNKGGELPQLERIGVGDHLMLGGDNMDLALAARVLQKLQQPVSPKNLNKLLTRCQLAKEQLLATDGPNELPIQFQSAGSQLFSNTQETRLTQKEVQQTILDGFFPEVACEAKPKTRKKALTDFSLPYPSDAGITRHIAAFLAEQQVALAKDHAYALPDTWLLNGGPFLSSQIEARLKSVVHSWQSNDTNWLRNPEPQTAVAKGAVQYGMALHKQTTLIKSAVVRHYFLKVSSDSGYKAVCILPKFSEPNSRITLDREFKLTKGKPVKFEVGYLLSEEPYHNGSIIDWHEKIHQLPSLETQIQGAGSTTIRLTTELDELGVLNVVMQEQDSEENWQLNFNIRQDKNTNKQEQLSSELVAALQVIEHWFGSAAVELPKEPLRKSLEKLLGPRENWSGNIARQLFDKLLDGAKKRRRSPQHERTWFNLAGFCLRPGIGFDSDTLRIDLLWPLYAQGIQYNQQVDIWSQWWTFWRRASAGLSQEQQMLLYSDCHSVLNAKKRKQAGKPKMTAAPEEKVKLLGSLERLPTDLKSKILQAVFSQLFDNKLGKDMVWTAARLINRAPLYTPDKLMLSEEAIEPYLEKLADLNSHKQKQVQMIIDASMASVGGSQELWGDALPTGLSLS